MTLRQLIERIKVVAIETANGDIQPLLLNTNVLIELLLPRCLEIVADKISRTPDGLTALRQQIVLTFAAGQSTWPDTIKEEHLETVVFHDDLPCSYVSSWFEFNTDPPGVSNPNDYSRFTVNNGKIFYHEVNQVRGSFNGNRTISAVSVPAMPANDFDTIVIRERVVHQLIVLAASVINGQTTLREIGLEYGSLEKVSKRAEQSE